MGVLARLLDRPIIVRLFAATGFTTLASILVVLALYRPAELAWSPICVWRTATGLRCPGCGLTRGLSALLHGEVLDALRLNPFVVVIPFLFLGLMAYCALAFSRGRLPRLGETPRYVGWSLFALLAGFWIFRTVIDLSELVR